MKLKASILSALLSLSIATPLHAETPQQTWIKQHSQSIVFINIYLKMDQGMSPQGKGYLCPNCDSRHYDSYEANVRNQLPLQLPGFLISEKEVICEDLLINRQFIHKITVSSDQDGDEVIGQLTAIAPDQGAWKVTLAEALPNKSPLFLVESEKSVAYQLGYSDHYGALQGVISPSGGPKIFDLTTNREFQKIQPNSLWLDEDGHLLSLAIKDRLQTNESPKRPDQWNFMSIEEFETEKKQVLELVQSSLVPVTLKFRPRTVNEQDEQAYYGHGSDRKIETEWFTAAIAWKPGYLFIPEILDEETTARLEQIICHTEQGDLNATFDQSLLHLGILTAKCPETLKLDALPSFEQAPAALRDETHYGIMLRPEKEKLNFHICRTTVNDISRMRNRLTNLSVSNDRLDFLINRDRKVAALHIDLRDAPLNESYGRDLALMPIQQVFAHLNNPELYNPENRPMAEDTVRPLAWLGIECQPLTPELAEFHKLTHEIEPGMGVEVTFVYPDSPAENAGIKNGDLILMIGETQTALIGLRLEGHHFGSQTFPWERLDEIPEQYYNQVPTPWPGRNTSMSKILDKFVNGDTYYLKIFSKGEKKTKSFTVCKGPVHYEAAKKLQAETIGLTLKPLTFEVARYFRKAHKAPGLIVSGITPGSKASTAGIKPYEIITHLNGEPITSPAIFEELMANNTTLQLTVERMGTERTVQISQ